MTFRPNPKPSAKKFAPSGLNVKGDTSSKTPPTPPTKAKSPRAMRGKSFLSVKSDKPLMLAATSTIERGPLDGPMTSTTVVHGQTKGALIQAMLTTPGGATSKELEAATGWQPHSVRGYLGTLRKKKINVISKKLSGEPTVYRIEATVAESAGEVL